MSRRIATIEERYAAVMEVKNGCSVWSTGRKYGMDTRTLRQFIYRYDHQGYKGLEDRPLHKFTESDKFSILIEYESGSISKEDLCIKHGIRENVLKEWLEQYEQYKKGNKFAMSRGCRGYRGYGDANNIIPQKQPPEKDKTMNDEQTQKLEERKKNLREMDKDALCELLLDREAEIEFLKKLEALDRERDRRQAMRRK